VNGGDLRGVVADHAHLSEVVVAHHIKQMLEGVHYLHSRGVVHRDIKLDNILLTQSGDVKVADFGLSALIQVGTQGYDLQDSGKRKKFDKLTDRWGTPMFYAPELINGAYGPQADIWSCGCVLYELLTGEIAFDVDDEDDENWQAPLFRKIRHASYDKTKLAQLGISSEAQDVLAKMLTPDPLTRWSATELLRHPWVTGTAHVNEQHNVKLQTTQVKIKDKQEQVKASNPAPKGGLLGFLFNHTTTSSTAGGGGSSSPRPPSRPGSSTGSRPASRK